MAKPFYSAGFTLFELLVTLAILTVISSLIFANYPEFQAGVSLKRTAQEIALSVREAEVYAIAVKGWEEEYEGYGIHFESVSPSYYLLFSDLDNNKSYDGGDELVKTFAIQTNDKITNLCGYDTIGTPFCGLSYLDIIFYRPTPAATLKGEGTDFSYVEIEITSPRGKQKNLHIEVNGQISIQ